MNTAHGGAVCVLSDGKDAVGDVAYERNRPEQALLYQLVGVIRAQGKCLPEHVRQKFEDYLKFGHLEHGFLRVRCDKCHFERLAAFTVKGVDSVPVVEPAAWTALCGHRTRHG